MDKTVQITVVRLSEETKMHHIGVLVVRWRRSLRACADLPLVRYRRLLIPGCAEMSRIGLTRIGRFLVAFSYPGSYAMVRSLVTEFDYRSHV